MRIIATFNKHPKIAISVFQMNDKYIVKLEAGNMEQAFKFLVSDVKTVENIDKMMDEKFITKAIERFNDMHLAMKEMSNFSEK
jgi:hypothetical protein